MKKPKKLPTILTMDEVNEIVKVTKKKHHKFAFLLAAHMGLRVSEIIKLKPKDIDYGRRVIKIVQGKGGKDRYVPIAPPLVRGLKTFIPYKCGIRALQRAFGRSVKLSGIKKDVHFHTLRHTAATNWIDKGKDLRVVQRWLGHSSISTTGIYLDLSPEKSVKEMEDMY